MNSLSSTYLRMERQRRFDRLTPSITWRSQRKPSRNCAPAEQARWLDVLEEEQANFGSAVYCYFQTGDYEKALRIAAAMWRFWWMRGPVREGQAHLHRLLAGSASVSAQVSPRVIGRALTGLSWLLLQTNDFEQAIVAASEAVNALAATEDEWSSG